MVYGVCMCVYYIYTQVYIYIYIYILISIMRFIKQHSHRGLTYGRMPNQFFSMKLWPMVKIMNPLPHL